MLCDDTCRFSSNTYCQDGGSAGDGGVDALGDACAYGTDCTDCGARYMKPPPSLPPSSPPPAPIFTVVSGSCVADATCVSSPNYPANYDSSDCIIGFGAGYAEVALSVFDLVTEDASFHRGCYDYLSLRVPGSSTWRKYCGPDTCSSTARSNGNYCGPSGAAGVSIDTGHQMRWVADSSIHASGFRICGMLPTPALPPPVSPQPPQSPHPPQSPQPPSPPPSSPPVLPPVSPPPPPYDLGLLHTNDCPNDYTHVLQLDVCRDAYEYLKQAMPDLSSRLPTSVPTAGYRNTWWSSIPTGCLSDRGARVRFNPNQGRGRRDYRPICMYSPLVTGSGNRE